MLRQAFQKSLTYLSKKTSFKGIHFSGKPSRGFSTNFDRFQRFLPHGSMTITLISANVSLFLIYKAMEANWTDYRFEKHFSLSLENLSQSRFHTFFTCHLVDNNLPTLISNSIVLFVFGRQFQRFYNTVRMARLVVLAMIVGSLFLSANLVSLGRSPLPQQQMKYMGTGVVSRSILYYLVYTSPYAKLNLFNVDVTIWYFGTVFLVMDAFRWQNAHLCGFVAAAIANFLAL